MKKLIRQWVKKYIVQEVPSELAVCEFACHQSKCNCSNWLTCERWKSYNRFLKAPLN